MQDDPEYAKMLEKSFIMNKYHQRHPRVPIPQVKKEPTFLHKVATTGILSTLIHCIAYPFDTIKIRKMAKHKLMDVARFDANNVVSLTPYLGFLKGYFSVMMGNLSFLIFGKEHFMLGILGEGLTKTVIDLAKISEQMGNISVRTDFYTKILPAASVFAVARDLTCRGSYILLLDYLIKANQTWLSLDTNRKYHLYFGCAIVATLLSHPFDLAFTKIASQRSFRYKGVFSTLQLIAK